MSTKKNQVKAPDELAPRESQRSLATTPDANPGQERQSKLSSNQPNRDKEFKKPQLSAPQGMSIERKNSHSSSAAHDPAKPGQSRSPSGAPQRDKMTMPPPKLPAPRAMSVDGNGSAPSPHTKEPEKKLQERLIEEQQAKERRRLIARMAMEEAKLDRERRRKARLEKQQQLKEQLVSLERKPPLTEKLKGNIEKRLRMSGYGGSQRDLGSLKPGSQYYKKRKALIKRTLVQELRTNSNPTKAKLMSMKIRKKHVMSNIAAAKKEVADLEDESLDADVEVTKLLKLKSNQDKSIKFAHLVEQTKAYTEGCQSQQKTLKTNPTQTMGDQLSKVQDVDGKRAEELRNTQKKAKKEHRLLKKACSDLKMAESALKKAQMNAQQKAEQRSVVREELEALREQCVQKTASELQDLKDYHGILEDLKIYYQELDALNSEELQSKKMKKQLRDIIDTTSVTAKRFEKRLKQLKIYSAPGDLPSHFTPPLSVEEEGDMDPAPECSDRSASVIASLEDASLNAGSSMDHAVADRKPSRSGSVLHRPHEPSKSTTDGLCAKWNYSEGRSRQPNMTLPPCPPLTRDFNTVKRPVRTANDERNTASPPESAYVVSHVFAAREYSSEEEEEEVELKLPRLAGRLSAITCATSRHLIALTGNKETAIRRVIKKPSASSPAGTADAPIVLDESDESDGESQRRITPARSLECITSRVPGAKKGKTQISAKIPPNILTVQKAMNRHPSVSPVKAAAHELTTNRVGCVANAGGESRDQTATTSARQRVPGRLHKIPK